MYKASLASRQLRVLVAEHSLADTGALRVTLDRASRWQQAGARIDLFVVEHDDDELAVPAGVTLHRATSVRRRLRQTVGPALVRLHRLAKVADVVVSGREIGNGLLGSAVAAASARRPFAVTVQSRPDIAVDEYVDPKLRSLTRRVLSRADLAVCVAAGIVPTLHELGLPESRTAVATNGMDVDAVRRAAVLSPESTLPDAPFVVGSGRLERQKGFDVLLRAHARALDAGAPDHHVVLLGDGPDRPALEALAGELGIESTVHFTGFVANPHAIVARAALFALPSRWEGYPLALVEALCVSTPAVATDCISGPDEVLDRGRFGKLVPVDDERAFATALLEHLRDPERLEGCAAAGAAEAAARFDPAVAAASHLALLTALVERRRAAR